MAMKGAIIFITPVFHKNCSWSIFVLNADLAVSAVISNEIRGHAEAGYYRTRLMPSVSPHQRCQNTDGFGQSYCHHRLHS